MSALADLRVIDLTRVLGGPYCTMLLADMGADVVKVEPPGGDFVRSTPPFPGGDEEPYGGYFQSVNRGKRSLELDFRDEADRGHLRTLAADADVLVENFRAGTMEGFGLGYERLRERNPGLVYASIRGFGDPRTGAIDRQDRPAYDLIAQALGGVMQVNGQPGSPPTKVGLGVGDIFTGTLNAVGILAALHHRERTGEGQYVDTSMYDSMVSLAERTVYQYDCTGRVPGRRGNAHPTLFPYDAFETADGLVVVAALGDGHWAALCDAMGRPDLAEAHPDQGSRLAARERLRETIADWTRDRSTEAVLDALDPDVPCAPVQDVADVFDDERVRQRDMLVEVPHPGADEPVAVAGNPIKLSGASTRPRGRAPLLDEHRAEVLAELGDTDGATGADEADEPHEAVGAAETAEVVGPTRPAGSSGSAGAAGDENPTTGDGWPEADGAPDAAGGGAGRQSTEGADR